MAKTQIRNRQIVSYREYYNDPNIAAWREISARDKAQNVILLWSKFGGTQPLLADIGCGDGALIRALDRKGFARAYTGMEISQSGLGKARNQKYHAPCNLILFDGFTIPFRDQSFDLAVLSHVLEHVECPRILIRETARIARRMFVEVPLEFNCRTPKHYNQTPVGHINLYNPLLLRQLLESCGLRVMAEQITLPGLASFAYERPFVKGWLHWAVKATFLRLLPSVASRCYTYHGCLLLEKA